MYEAHYGFSGPPFQLNPDPSFYFNSRGHGHALAYLRYGAAQGEGFIVVTGEIGAGKTTLVRTLLDELDRAKIVPAQIVSTQLAEGELLQAILAAYGIPSQGTSKASLLATLEAFLMTLATQGRRALLIVDEAQNLQTKVIEELRMLSNFQLGTHALLQSFLVGQPELRKKLESPDLEQLRQRVTASCHLGPLDVPETRAYIEHRLRRVGWDAKRPHFSDAAFREVHRWSGGVPRRINRLCNRLLLASFLESDEAISIERVEATAMELRQEIGEAFEPLPPEQSPELQREESAPVASEPSVVSAAPAINVDAGALDLDLSPPEPPALPEAIEQAAIEPLHELAAGVAQDSGVPAPTAPTPDADLPATGGPVQNADASVAEPDTLAVEETGKTAEAVTETPVRQPVHVEYDAPTPLDTDPEAALPADVVHTSNLVLKPGDGVLLCLADTPSAALKVAAIAKVLATVDGAPRLMLVNPGLKSVVWPWDEMESVLPALESGWHLHVPGSSLETQVGPLFHRLGEVIDEAKPLGLLSLGNSEAVLACSLYAHKRGLPVLRVEAGERPVAGEAALNALLIEQIAALLFATNVAADHQRLFEMGVMPGRVFGVPGQLAQDVQRAVEPAMTTSMGAFLRHNLPIYLGPRWSTQVDGTPYAVVAMGANSASGVDALLSVLLRVEAVSKFVWLVDESTHAAVSDWFTTKPEAAQRVYLIGDGPMTRAELDQRDRATVLCRQVSNLPDQFSVLRGAVCLLTEPIQLLADVAQGLNVPALVLDGAVVRIQEPGQPVGEARWDPASLNEQVASWVAASQAEVAHSREDYETDPMRRVTPRSEELHASPAAGIAARLHTWVAQRQKTGSDATEAGHPEASVASAA